LLHTLTRGWAAGLCYATGRPHWQTCVARAAATTAEPAEDETPAAAAAAQAAARAAALAKAQAAAKAAAQRRREEEEAELAKGRARQALAEKEEAAAAEKVAAAGRAAVGGGRDAVGATKVQTPPLVPEGAAGLASGADGAAASEGAGEAGTSVATEETAPPAATDETAPPEAKDETAPTVATDETEGTNDTPRLDDAKWEAQLARLVAYKAAHGDCKVPTAWPADPRLANWVMTQRMFIKKLDRGEPNRKITAERAAKLEALGFVDATAATDEAAAPEGTDEAAVLEATDEAAAPEGTDETAPSEALPAPSGGSVTTVEPNPPLPRVLSPVEEEVIRERIHKEAGLDEGLLSFCLPILVYMENPC
jgi:hypothetical protein